MATFNVKARSFTPESVVAGSTTYYTDTTIIPSKTLTVAATAAVGLPSAGGNAEFSNIYNSTAFNATQLGDGTWVLLVSANENNNDNVRIYQQVKASGSATADAEIFLSLLTPGSVLAVPFRTNSLDTDRDEVPNLLAIRANAVGTSVPTIEVSYSFV